MDVLVPAQLYSDMFSHADFVASLAGKLHTAFARARQHGAAAHESQKLYYDVATRHHPYAEGELVWLHNPTEDRLKLAPHWKEPYKVLAVLSSQGETGLSYWLSFVFQSRLCSMID